MDVAQAMERTFEALKGNEKALERLNHIMNHTGMTEDGERLFINAKDAAEVYTIVFMAWSGGKESLDDLVRYMDDEKDRAITAAAVVRIIREDEESFDVETVDIEGTALIATDWT